MKEPKRANPEELLQKEFQEKWIDKKIDAGTLAEVYKCMGEQHRSDRVRDCGSFLQYAVPADFSELPKLHYANFCRDRLCPMCNWRRSRKIFGQISQIMELIGKKYKYIFLTLTVRNCSGEKLPEMVRNMQAAWNRLAGYKEIKAAFKGTVRTLEIVRHAYYKPEIQYHPHFHCIIAVNPSYFTDSKSYISQKRFRELWMQAMRIPYDPSVMVSLIKPKKLEELEFDEPPAEWKKSEIRDWQAIAETAKYAVKSADYLRGKFPVIQKTVATFLASLEGRRLVNFTGVFRDMKRKLGLDDGENGDLIHTDIEDKLRDDLQYILLTYHWQIGLGYQLQDAQPFKPSIKSLRS